MQLDGLSTHQNVLDAPVLAELLDFLNTTTEWKHVTSCTKSREVIHFGREYNYRSRHAGAETKPFPPVIKQLATLLAQMTGDIFDQCIINKYLPGQGIGEHIDAHDFGPVIGCFTVGQENAHLGQMEFILNGQTLTVPTPHNSLYIMQREARNNARHAMIARKTDMVNGKITPRSTRISITFRRVL